MLIALGATLGALAMAGPAQAAFPGSNGKLAFGERGTIWTVDSDGRGQTALRAGAEPAWSPDGRRLAFTHGGAVWVSDAHGAHARRVASGGRSPAFSWDGRSLLVSNAQAPGIQVIDLVGGTIRSLGASGSGAVWAKGDAAVYFTSDGDIYRVSASGGPVQLVKAGAEDVSVSPDGARLVYGVNSPSRFDCFHPCPSGELRTLDIATGAETTVLTDGSDAVDVPVLSPDGRRVAYVQRGWTGRSLTIADVAPGSAPTLVYSHEVDRADWQPVGSALPPPVVPPAAGGDPDCSTVGRGPWELGTANRRLKKVVLYGGRDPDGDRTWITINAVRQDERVLDRGDATVPDAVRTKADNVILLRAERQPRGDGRVYRIGFTLHDARGGSCRGVVSVGVRPRSGRPARDSGHRYDSFRVGRTR
jgi:dipeptidyl aminopeptidase/acylaminoacyl peptidase